jgi:TRAP-type C4-dicarboxylate transport system permease small subunit
MLHRASAVWARVELTLAALLAGAITLLILLNVVTRAFDASIYWVDEAAIYTMAWMTFLAGSAAVHYGNSVSVTLIEDAVGPALGRALRLFKDLCVLLFALLMLWFCWRWYLPADLAAAGFDLRAFQGATFNFIYNEPTTTLGIRKWWIWLVMWLFAFGLLLHGLSNLLGGGQRGERTEAT